MVDELSKPIFSASSFIQSTNNLSNRNVRDKQLSLKNEKSGRSV